MGDPHFSDPIFYYYIADALGNIRYIQDQNLKTVNSYEYDSFGNITKKTEGIEKGS